MFKPSNNANLTDVAYLGPPTPRDSVVTESLSDGPSVRVSVSGLWFSEEQEERNDQLWNINIAGVGLPSGQEKERESDAARLYRVIFGGFEQQQRCDYLPCDTWLGAAVKRSGDRRLCCV